MERDFVLWATRVKEQIGMEGSVVKVPKDTTTLREAQIAFITKMYDYICEDIFRDEMDPTATCSPTASDLFTMLDAGPADDIWAPGRNFLFSAFISNQRWVMDNLLRLTTDYHTWLPHGPYLGLRALRGPVTYTFLEGRGYHSAQAIVLLGDEHSGSTCTSPCVGFRKRGSRRRKWKPVGSRAFIVFPLGLRSGFILGRRCFGLHDRGCLLCGPSISVQKMTNDPLPSPTHSPETHTHEQSRGAFRNKAFG